MEEFDGVAVDIGVVEGLLGSHCLHSLYVFVLLLLAVYDRPLPYLDFPLTFFMLELMLFQEVDLVFLVREEQEFLLNGVAVWTVDELFEVIAALEAADEVFELVT